MMSTAPPAKKRRLTNVYDEEDYVPSDQESAELAFDDQEEDVKDVDSESADEDSDLQLSGADQRIVADINRKLASWTATQLKCLLKEIKTLRSIDGEAIFEGICATGKKGEIQSRIRRIIVMVYLGVIVVEPDTRVRWARYAKTYRDNIDFVSFKSRIQSAIRLVDSQKSGKKAVMSASLLARLSACDKHQIIAALDAMLRQQPEGQAQAAALEQLLPKPNLESTFARYKALMAAIHKAQPRTRYGSGRDHYCFKRCRAAINAAKKAMLADGKALMSGKDWDSCLEYLVVEMERVFEFPKWDDAGDNTAVRDLKKTLKGWHAKVKKGLGAKATPVQERRLHKVAAFVNQE